MKPFLLRFGVMTLTLTITLAPSYAASPSRARAEKGLRPSPVRIYAYEPKQRLITPRTSPHRLMTSAEWARFVRTQMPQMGKVDAGPFAIWQQRLFERGDTLVPPSTNTF